MSKEYIIPCLQCICQKCQLMTGTCIRCEDCCRDTEKDDKDRILSSCISFVPKDNDMKGDN